jgi:hypothetical protein
MGQCTAKSKRSREQCRNWAIRGRTTCRMHGGKSKGPRTKNGRERVRLASLKHGEYAKEAIAEQKEIRELIRRSQELLDRI